MGRIYPEIEILAEAIRHHELQLSVAPPEIDEPSHRASGPAFERSSAENIPKSDQDQRSL
jgi:hypothetical protein